MAIKKILANNPDLDVSGRFFVSQGPLTRFNSPPSNSVLSLEETTGLVDSLVASSIDNQNDLPPAMPLVDESKYRVPSFSPLAPSLPSSSTPLGVETETGVRRIWCRSHNRTNSITNPTYVAFNTFQQFPLKVLPEDPENSQSSSLESFTSA